MKKILFTLVTTFFAVWTMAQDEPVAPLQYDMTFKGRGEATSVQTVKVENLTRGTSLDLSGADILRLTNTPSQNGIEDIKNAPKVHSVVYPNPSYGQASVIFANRVAGKVQISITDLSGKTMANSVFELETGKHSAILPAMPNGTYIVSLSGTGINEAVKWVSYGGGNGGTIRLEGVTDNAPMAAPAAKNDDVADVETRQVTSLQDRKPTSTVYWPVIPQEVRAANANIVEMLYADGELLRFTGKNGNMKTIVMAIPSISHNITFDFFACTDASGYHYTIVNAGGLLWMVEDLRMVSGGSTGIAQITNAEAWADTYSENIPKAAYYQYSSSNAGQGAFYNYAAAKLAMPAGWNLPTQGEIDYMFKHFANGDATQGYARGTQLLKSRASGDWTLTPAGLDTVSFCGIAAGELNTSGAFAGKGSLMRYWTRSTKNLKPNYWGILNNNVQNTANANVVEQPDFYGLRVRGVRQAPSDLEEVMNIFRTMPSGAPMRAPTESSVFETGPLGGNYTLAINNLNLWQEVNAKSNANPQIQYIDYYTNTLKSLPENKGHNDVLQKATAQTNNKGRQNLVVAMWSKPTALTTVGATDVIDGVGYVSLITYGDTIDGYARVDSIRLPTQYTMPVYINSGYTGIPVPSVGFTASPQEINFDALHSGDNLIYCLSNLNDYKSIIESRLDIRNRRFLQHYIWYAKRLNAASADFNGDGVGDIVINVGDRIDIYDGVTHSILQTKTFPSNNLRMAVGDIDGDNNPDLAVIYPVNTDYSMVQVYKDGVLGNNANYTVSVPYGNNNDIKIGQVKPNGKNSIVILSRTDFSSNPGMPVVRLINFDASGGGSIVTESTANWSWVAGTDGQGNDNITLCRFRGSAFPADIVTGNYVLRYNNNTNTLSAVNGNTTLTNSNAYILADQIVAGNFNRDPEGKETLEYIATGVGSYSANSWTAPTLTGITGNTGWLPVNQSDYNTTFWSAVGVGTTYYSLVNWYKKQDFNYNITLNYSIFHQKNKMTASNVAATSFSVTNSGSTLTTSGYQANVSGSGQVCYWQLTTFDNMTNFPVSLHINSASYTIGKQSAYPGHTFGIVGATRSTEAAKTLKFMGHRSSMTEPTIYALIAAPPYFKYQNDGQPYTYGDFGSMGTSWGKSKVVGNATSNETTNSVTAIFGFEFEYSAPVVGIKVGSIELTQKLESEWTNSTEKQVSTTQAIEFTTPQKDAIILSATFYDTYQYKIVASSNPDEVGAYMSISIPDPVGPRTMGLTLDDYNRLRFGFSGSEVAPSFRYLFQHKEGFPFTYPSEKSQIENWKMANSTVLWAAPFGGEEFISTGSGTDVNRSITLDSETATTSGFTFKLETELVVTAGCVKVGAGYGHAETNLSTHTEGEGHSIAGHVLAPNSVFDNVPQFRWNVCWFKHRSGKHEFPVVYYVVKE